jgi:hypothetical protein
MTLIAVSVGFFAMMGCLVVQGALLMLATRHYCDHTSIIENSSRLRSMLLISQVMIMLVLGNLLQGALWALLFMGLGEFAQFREAFYHSLVNFATLGYGDIVMSERWRLLGPIQAINGVLMIGVSTAAITTVVQDALERRAHLRMGRKGEPMD